MFGNVAATAGRSLGISARVSLGAVQAAGGAGSDGGSSLMNLTGKRPLGRPVCLLVSRARGSFGEEDVWMNRNANGSAVWSLHF